MSTTIIYPFTTPENYTFDPLKAEIDSGQGKLILLEAAQTFTEDFADDTGFTYDNTKAEFSAGKIQQKSSKPSDMTFAANYNLGIDGNYGDGVLTATANGGAVVTANKLDLSASGANVNYPTTGNADHAHIFAFRFKWTPDYTGIPGDRKNLIYQDTGAGLVNSFTFKHETTGLLYLLVRDNASGSAVVLSSSWSPTSGTEYEFEVNVDITNGNSYFYVDGVRSSVATGTGSRDIPTTLRIGDTSGTTGLIDDLQIFDALQHSGASYTPGYTVNDYQYEETPVDLPAFNHTGDGSILSYLGLTLVSEVGAIRYQIKTDAGSYKYWTGSAWAVSDGTYAQSNTSADMDTNLPTLTDASGALSSTIKMIFPEGAIVSSLDNLVLDHTGNSGYSTDNPTIHPLSSFYTTELQSFSVTSTEAGSDLVKYVLNVGGQDKYWNGAAWVDSSSYAESNTATEVNDNLLSLVSTRSIVYPKAYLHSNDGSTTPSIDLMTLTYDLALSNPNEPTLVNLEGFIYDSNGPIVGQIIKFRPYQSGWLNVGIMQKYAFETIATTEAGGYFAGSVYLQPANRLWEMRVGSQSYKVELLDQADMNIVDAPTFEAITDE